MSEQLQQPAQKPATPGEWLRAERERQGRTVQQVATDLHLSTQIVEAIETNRFSVLGAPVFARGHLRNYAKFLGLPIDRAHELYDSLSDRPRDQDPVPVIHRSTEPSIPMTPDSKEREASPLPMQWIAAIGVGVVALIALAVWWFTQASDQPAPAPAVEPTPSSNVERVEPTAPAIASVPTTSATDSSGPPSTAASGTAAPGAMAPSSATQAAQPRPTMRLQLSFAEQSWVEVYDARGNRRLYDVGEAGQTRTVQVEPPAEVVLGNAAVVSIEANGRAVAVPAGTPNQVARFKVRADGSIR